MADHSKRMRVIALCYGWAWCWSGFWNGWRNEAKGVLAMVWMALLGFVGALIQTAYVVIYPVWRLLIEPLKAGLTLNERQAENLRKV